MRSFALMSVSFVLMVGGPLGAAASLMSMPLVGSWGSPSVNTQQNTDDYAIREVVARDFLREIRNAKAIVFVAIDDDKDPSDDLLKRLSDIKVSLRKWSRGKDNRDRKSEARLRIDRETGEFGGVLPIGRIERSDKATVEVEAEQGFTRLHGEGGTLVLEKVRGRWKLVEIKDWGFASSPRTENTQIVCLCKYRHRGHKAWKETTTRYIARRCGLP
jgi:hypothetical protein